MAVEDGARCRLAKAALLVEAIVLLMVEVKNANSADVKIVQEVVAFALPTAEALVAVKTDAQNTLYQEENVSHTEAAADAKKVDVLAVLLVGVCALCMAEAENVKLMAATSMWHLQVCADLTEEVVDVKWTVA